MNIEMRVGIDFDGTEADTSSCKSNWLKEVYGLSVPPSQCDNTSCRQALTNFLMNPTTLVKWNNYLQIRSGGDLEAYLQSKKYGPHNASLISDLLTQAFHMKEVPEVFAKDTAHKIYDSFRDFVYIKSGLEYTSPIAGAHEAMKQMAESKKHLYTITARPEGEVLDAALWWQEKHGSNKFLKGYFSAEVIDPHFGRILSKGEICDVYGFTVHIDDDLRHLQKPENLIDNFHRILIRIGEKEGGPLQGTGTQKVPPIYAARSWKEVSDVVQELEHQIVQGKIPIRKARFDKAYCRD